jgi:NADH:ubiquinone reductase (H+-translocating)
MKTQGREQPNHKKRVVIVGGGFAGMSCARKLASNPAVEITLIR